MGSHSRGAILPRSETPLQPQRGIATKNGLPIAVQVSFTDGPYPNKMLSNGNIEHIGEGRSGLQQPKRGNGAMLAAARKGTRVPVYEKVGSDQYRYLGDYTVESHRMEQLAPRIDPDWVGYVFTLRPIGETFRVNAAT